MIVTSHGKHPIGCLVTMLSLLNMRTTPLPLPFYESLTKEAQTVDIYTPEGLKLFKAALKQNGTGSIVIWADAVTGEQYSGEGFYNFLESQGQHVQRSEVVRNPTGSPRAALYIWYFRKRNKRISRPAASTGGETVEKKTPPASNRAAGTRS